MFERRADRWQAGLVMGALLLGLWAWMQVPAEMQVPIHFDMRGVPDGWGSPAMAFVFLPVRLSIAVASRLSLVRVPEEA